MEGAVRTLQGDVTDVEWAGIRVGFPECECVLGSLRPAMAVYRGA